MARSLQPVFRHAVLTRLFDYRRISGIKEDIKLRLIQILDVFGRCRFIDAVGLIENNAKVADAAEAGLAEHRRLARFDARIAADALLPLSGFPVLIDLLGGASRDAQHTATDNL